MDHRVCRAVAKVRRQIGASATPRLPLLWTEWNVPGMHELRDTAYVGPALANTIRECDGLVDALSFWTFSDVFEEGGPIPKPFEGHFGLRAEGGINKPSYYDFALLHRLGNAKLTTDSPEMIVTRREDGTLAIAIWNLVDAAKGTGPAKTFDLQFENVAKNAAVTISLVDGGHSNTLTRYRALGAPLYPTADQVAKMNAATAIRPETVHLNGDRLHVTLQPNALMLLELGKTR